MAAAFHPSIRPLGAAAADAAAFAAGAVGLTVEAILLEPSGSAGPSPALGLPLFAVSAALAGVWRRREPQTPGRGGNPSPGVAAAALLASSAACVHLAAKLVTARDTSVDFVFFWGVKAARFAQAGGFDVSLLASPFFLHAAPDYPPLAPVVQAWAALIAGRMSWRGAPMVALLWFVAAMPLVFAALRRVLPANDAAAVAGFWGAALGVSLASSYSGGNAEAPLLFFETVAGAMLLSERRGVPSSRFLPGIALCGAALTKVEGSVGALLLIAGTGLRDRLAGEPRWLRRAADLLIGPTLALALWFGFQAVSGLPVGYRGHGRLFDLHLENAWTVLREGLYQLNGSTAWLAWLVPLASLLLLRGARHRALPGLVAAGGLLLFFLFDYLHDVGDPSERIGWTLPRVSQPALSLTILAAGIAAFDPASRRVRFGKMP